MGTKAVDLKVARPGDSNCNFSMDSEAPEEKEERRKIKRHLLGIINKNSGLFTL